MATEVTRSNSTIETNTEASSKKPKGWFGRSFCRIDKLTLLFGACLLITGIVLLILNALYTYDLYKAGLITACMGSSIFFLGLITHSCYIDVSKSRDKTKNSKTTAASPTKTCKPLDEKIETRAFFESKGIFGLPQELIDEINLWRKYRSDKNFPLTLDAGFLLSGPPGTGKTTIATAIAEILGGDYFEKKCGDLKDSHYGQSEKNINALFEVPEGQFRVIVIDEISGLLSKRDGWWTDSVKEHFLGIVSGTGQKKANYILIGTTNTPQRLDEAMIRRGRLGSHFTINNPNEAIRTQIFNHHLSKMSLSKEEDWTDFAALLAKKTANSSCADIAGFINDAQKRALLANRQELKQQDFLSHL